MKSFLALICFLTVLFPSQIFASFKGEVPKSYPPFISREKVSERRQPFITVRMAGPINPQKATKVLREMQERILAIGVIESLASFEEINDVILEFVPLLMEVGAEKVEIGFPSLGLRKIFFKPK